MSENIENLISKSKLVAVLVLEELESVPKVAEALLEGGVTTIELTLRTAVAFEAIKIITKEFPEILCGVGTILTPDQVRMSKNYGAHYGVSPGLNRRVLDLATDLKFPFFPGISTPSDVEQALEYGIKTLKFFPAENLGGINYLKALNAPYKHLGIKYMPLGGLNISNLEQYFKEPIVIAVGGSWIASPSLIKEKKWDEIRSNSKQAIELINGFRGN